MSFKVKDAHWEVMVSFMEEHPSLATGIFKGPNGRASLKLLWGELTVKLNSLGYGERSPEKWQKTWTDLKYLLKKKASNTRKDLKSTGGGLPTEAPLNKHERRVLQILGDSFYQGTGNVEIGSEIAMPSTSKMPTPVAMLEEPLHQEEEEHDYSFQPPPKKSKKNTQLNDQYQETITVLKEINNTVATGLEKVAASINNLAEALSKNK